MALVAVTAFNAFVALLDSQAAGNFTVHGYQSQKKSAAKIAEKPLVQCWIDSATVDRSRSTQGAGPKTHEIRIGVRFSIARPSLADLATLQNEASTEGQRATALANLTGPDYNAAITLYAAWEAVWDIVYDARNQNFALAEGTIQDRWFSDFQADDMTNPGAWGILTATSYLEFRVVEPILGDTGTAIGTMDAEIQGADVDENVDEISQAGTEQDY